MLLSTTYRDLFRNLITISWDRWDHIIIIKSQFMNYAYCGLRLRVPNSGVMDYKFSLEVHTALISIVFIVLGVFFFDCRPPDVVVTSE